MRSCMFGTLVILGAFGLPGSSAAAAVSIVRIDASPDPISLANGISADGSTVVGRSMNSDGLNHAFRWTGALGFQPLGSVPPPSEAYAASATGAVVVGMTFPAAGGSQQAARWSIGGTQILAPLAGDVGAEPLACSGDGSIVVGRSFGSSGQQAVRWSAAGVAEKINTDHPGSGLYKAVGISSDAQVIVGNTGLGSGSIFRWTASGGYEAIPDGGIAALVARALSADGSTIVGSGLFPGSTQAAMRWTAAGGYESLGVLPNTGGGNALSCNGDGTLIGGESGGRAFIWTPTIGIVDLAAYLGGMGVDASHWQFWNVTGISADGSTLTGTGVLDAGLPTAFIITGIPSPGGAIVLGVGPLIMMFRRTRSRA